jgi:hypothetical protein
MQPITICDEFGDGEAWWELYDKLNVAKRMAYCDVSMNRDDKTTPLLMACENWADASTVSALIKCGADVNHVGWGSRTPLGAVCEQSANEYSAAVARCLLDAGAEIDIKPGGSTPLVLAIKKYYESCIRDPYLPTKDTALLLLARGADFTRAMAIEERERELMGRRGDWDAESLSEVLIFDERILSALWRRLQLYAFGKPARYTSSVPHRVAADPYLSRHIGSFLVGDVRPTKKK